MVEPNTGEEVDPRGETRADLDDPTLSGDREPATPLRFYGRYEVRARLGAGGMGTVFLARDPDLDREVAIKVLHPDIAEEHRARLFAEAKTMARLVHPNVVTVFDLGEEEGRIFVAMERVKGGTLRQWVVRKRPSWRELVLVYRDAARGLHAAHAEGIVHRDFKPDNVLIAEDASGTPIAKVTDFGLARIRNAPTGAVAESIGIATHGGDHRASDAKLAGSPPYMAPETIRGARSNAHSDQFSFAVALHESVYGALPFEAESIIALFAQITGGLRRPRPDVRVPARLAKVIDRGLDRDPQRRHPSLLAVADALDDCLVPRWRRYAVPLVGVAVIGSAAAGALVAGGDAPTPCRGAELRIAEAWNEDRARTVEAAIVATGVPYADAAREQVRTRLDDYAGAWARAHTSACEATHVEGAQSPEALEMRVRCLDERRAALMRTAELLEHPDAAMMEHAVAMASALPSLAHCEDPSALSAEFAPPSDPAIAAEIDAVREQLEGPRAQLEARRYDDALAAVVPLVARADALGYDPLRVEVRAVHGQALSDIGRYADAEPVLREAYELAIAVGHERALADITASLTMVVGFHLARQDAGRAWGISSESYARRVDPEGRELAGALNGVGIVLATSGELDAAGERFEHALRIWETQPGEPGIGTAGALTSLGNLRSLQGRLDDAVEIYARAEALATESFGAQHPTVGTAYGNLALVLDKQGKREEALVAHRRALAIHEAAYGPDHPSVAFALNNAAVVLDELGRPAEAMPLYERALAIRERAYGPEHTYVAQTLDNIGLSLDIAGKPTEGIVFHLRALALFEKLGGPNVLGALERTASAEERLKRLDEALVHRERAVTLAKQLGDDPSALPYTELELAKLRWTRGEHAAARSIAEQAREHANGVAPEQHAAAETWLREHERDR